MAALFKTSFKNLKLSVKNVGYSLRYVSSPLTPNVQNYSATPLWSKKVNNFGYLRVFSGNFAVHLTGSSARDRRDGEQSTIGVSLVSDSKDLSGEDLQVIKECVSCDTSSKNDGMSHVLIEAGRNSTLQKLKPTLLDKLKLLIQLPYSYDLYLNNATESEVTVEKLECNNIEIHSESNCLLSQLKSRLITVNSNSGGIISESLIGDLALTSGKDGSIRLAKVQGTDVKINCESGDVNIISLYGGNVLVNTQHGNVIIGDAHGNVEVTSTTGDIKCGSILGMLRAVTEVGNIETKLTLGGNIDATSYNGNATIKLDSDLSCKLDLSSQTTNISSDLDIYEKSATIADGLTTLTGQTKGDGEQHVQVKCHKALLFERSRVWYMDGVKSTAQ